MRKDIRDKAEIIIDDIGTERSQEFVFCYLFIAHRINKYISAFPNPNSQYATYLKFKVLPSRHLNNHVHNMILFIVE